MSMALEHFWQRLSLKNPSHVALSFTSGLCYWEFCISMIAMRIAVPIRQFIKRATSYDYIVLARTVLVVLHST